MATAPRQASRLRLDVMNLTLLLVGIACAIISYQLVEVHDVNVLVIVPSVLAISSGARGLFKREAPRI